jgi:hypothetical protein
MYVWKSALADCSAAFPNFTARDRRDEVPADDVWSKTETVTVASPYKYELEYLPARYPAPTVTVGGNSRTVVAWYEGITLSAGEVAVGYSQPVLLFHSSDNAGAGSITYYARGSVSTAAFENGFQKEIMAIQDYVLATPYARTIIVAKTGGDYDSVQDAIDSITDDTEQTLILIYPGTYDEACVLDKDNVVIRGVSIGACTIRHDSIYQDPAQDGDFPMQVLGDHCMLENLSFYNGYNADLTKCGTCVNIGTLDHSTEVTEFTMRGCSLVSPAKDTFYSRATSLNLVIEYCFIDGYNHIISDDVAVTIRVNHTTLVNRFTSGACINLNSPSCGDVNMQANVQIGGVVFIDSAASSGSTNIFRFDGLFCNNYLVTALLQCNGNCSGHLYYNNVTVNAITAGTYSSNWTVHPPTMWGIGTNLTALNASSLASGNIPYARMPTGSGTWALPGTATVAGTTATSTDYTAVAITGTTSHSSGTMASLSCMTIGPPAKGAGTVTTAIGLITKCPTGVGTYNYAHQVQGTMSIIDYGTSPHTNGGLICTGTWGIACGSVQLPGYGKIVAQGNVGIGGADTVTGYSVAELYRYAWIANGTTNPNAGALGLFGGFYPGAGGGLGVRESNILVGTYNLSTYNADYVHLKILSAGNSPTKLHMSAPGTSGAGNQLVDATVFTSDSSGFQIETANNRSMNIVPHGTGVLTVDTDELSVSGAVGAAVKTRLGVGSATIPTSGVALQVTGGIEASTTIQSTQAGGFLASDDSPGISATIQVQDSNDMNVYNLTFKDGLLVSKVDACFRGAALVDMADGTKRRIDDILVGDEATTGTVEAINIGYHETRVISINGHTGCSPSQHIQVNDVWMRADAVRVGDILHDGTIVVSVEVLGNTEPVYDLRINGEHNYTVEGMLAYDDHYAEDHR